MNPVAVLRRSRQMIQHELHHDRWRYRRVAGGGAVARLQPRGPVGEGTALAVHGVGSHKRDLTGDIQRNQVQGDGRFIRPNGVHWRPTRKKVAFVGYRDGEAARGSGACQIITATGAARTQARPEAGTPPAAAPREGTGGLQSGAFSAPAQRGQPGALHHPA